MELDSKLTIETIHGYASIKSELLKQSASKVQYDNIFVLFTGDKDENGVSWCPDCEIAEPVITQNLDKIKGNSIFYKCYVGNREQWKDQRNQFRLDPLFQLRCVPTLVKIGTPMRLVEQQCSRADLVDLLFTEDDDEVDDQRRASVNSIKPQNSESNIPEEQEQTNVASEDIT